jgi:nanoRNase/pAp phosphatase (c-di-AMP/oligoRNAs hydrolase)
VHQKDELLYTYYDETELKKYNIDQEEAGYWLHIIQNVDWPQMVLLLRKVGDIIRWSLRAKKPEGKNMIKIDCNKIAQGLWGWGHKLAAWFGVPSKGKFEKQIEDIVKYINKIAKTEH